MDSPGTEKTPLQDGGLWRRPCVPRDKGKMAERPPSPDHMWRERTKGEKTTQKLDICNYKNSIFPQTAINREQGQNKKEPWSKTSQMPLEPFAPRHVTGSLLAAAAPLTMAAATGNWGSSEPAVSTSLLLFCLAGPSWCQYCSSMLLLYWGREEVVQLGTKNGSPHPACLVAAAVAADRYLWNMP